MPQPDIPCPYPPEFLNRQRGRLLAARERLTRDLGRADDSEGSEDGAAGLDVLPEAETVAEPSAKKPAEPTSEAGAGAFRLSADELRRGLDESSRSQLEAVNAALERMDAGIYGWDAEAGAWLSMARLAALPSASAEIRAG